ncbi:hypothetical protein TRAPUB_8872 [Trametes pubescens]|uniref:Uncharacterized protein n=1 Tax=Trametes pubescens TaxID=154538 RepID=A0A1M2W492_TRAPU|nr:hypothetical protein TRAPUB_8872 [Trametes pubescens]
MPSPVVGFQTKKTQPEGRGHCLVHVFQDCVETDNVTLSRVSAERLTRGSAPIGCKSLPRSDDIVQGAPYVFIPDKEGAQHVPYGASHARSAV